MHLLFSFDTKIWPLLLLAVESNYTRTPLSLAEPSFGDDQSGRRFFAIVHSVRTASAVEYSILFCLLSTTFYLLELGQGGLGMRVYTNHHSMLAFPLIG